MDFSPANPGALQTRRCTLCNRLASARIRRKSSSLQRISPALDRCANRTAPGIVSRNMNTLHFFSAFESNHSGISIAQHPRKFRCGDKSRKRNQLPDRSWTLHRRTLLRPNSSAETFLRRESVMGSRRWEMRYRSKVGSAVRRLSTRTSRGSNEEKKNRLFVSLLPDPASRFIRHKKVATGDFALATTQNFFAGR